MASSEPPTIPDNGIPEPDEEFVTISRPSLPKHSAPAEDITVRQADMQQILDTLKRSVEASEESASASKKSAAASEGTREFVVKFGNSVLESIATHSAEFRDFKKLTTEEIRRLERRIEDLENAAE